METKITTLRIPEDLHEWIKEKADEQHRSITGQIVYLLSQKKEDNEKV